LSGRKPGLSKTAFHFQVRRPRKKVTHKKRYYRRPGVNRRGRDRTKETGGQIQPNVTHDDYEKKRRGLEKLRKRKGKKKKKGGTFFALTPSAKLHLLMQGKRHRRNTKKKKKIKIGDRHTRYQKKKKVVKETDKIWKTVLKPNFTTEER